MLPSYRIPKQNIHNLEVGKGEGLDIFAPWDYKSALNIKDGLFYRDESSTQHHLLTYAGVRSIYGKLPLPPGPSTMCSALSAPDISQAHIRAAAAQTAVSLRLTAVPSPSQEPLPAEESREGSKWQHSKGHYQRLPSAEKSCDEQGRKNPNYGGLSLVCRRQQS